MAEIRPPRVFISATSGDLATVRTAIKEALLTVGCYPVEQTNFPPDYRGVLEMLRDKIATCQAVIHVVGMRYGAEPDPLQLPPNTPRRSYTQLEYDLAGELHKKLYTFVCPPSFPYDAALTPEDDEKQKLQQEHRQRVEHADRLYTPVTDRAALGARVRELQVQLQSLKGDIDRDKRRILVATVLLASAMIALAGGSWWGYQQLHADVAQASTIDTEKIRAHLRHTIDATRARELAEADKSPNWKTRKRLREAADESHSARVARIDELAASFTEIESSGAATSVLQEMSRILSENGVDDAIEYVANQRVSILEKVRTRAAAARERNRADLQPLLKTAALYENKNQLAEAHQIYTDILAAEPDWPDAMHAYCRLLLQQGDFAKLHANLNEAQSSYHDSHLMAKRLNALDLKNMQWQRDLSQSFERLGDVAFRSGNCEEALKYFGDSMTLIKKRASIDPSNLEWQRDLAICDCDLADVALDQNDLHEAEKKYEDGLRVFEKLVASNPKNLEWQRDLALMYQSLGFVALRSGRGRGEGHDYYLMAIDILRTLAYSEPASIERQSDLADSYLSIAQLEEGLGNPGSSEMWAADAIAIQKKVASADPTNINWQLALWNSYQQLGELAMGNFNLGDAHRNYGEGLALIKGLAAKDPTNIECQRDLANNFKTFADVKMAQEKLDDAVRNYRESIATTKKLMAKYPADIALQRDLWECYFNVGDAARRQAKLEEAGQNFSEALTIGKKLMSAEPTNWVWVRYVSYSYDALADVAAAQPNLEEAAWNYSQSLAIVQKLEASDPDNLREYVEQELETLNKRAASDRTNTGWQRDLSACYMKLAETVMERTHDLVSAVQNYAKAMAISKALTIQDPSNTEWQHEVSEIYSRMTDTESAIYTDFVDFEAKYKQIPHAVEYMETSSHSLEILAKLDPSNAKWQKDVKASRELLEKLRSSTTRVKP